MVTGRPQSVPHTVVAILALCLLYLYLYLSICGHQVLSSTVPHLADREVTSEIPHPAGRVFGTREPTKFLVLSLFVGFSVRPLSYIK